MAYNAWFQCINGCPGEFDLREVIYRCPTCGDLLEVQHDMEALRVALGRGVDPALRRPRTGATPTRTAPGVWGKKEWVVPFIDNENIVSMYEGNSNLLWADRYGKQLHVEDLWVKQCGNSHTGSFKDLGMTVLVSVVKQMIADGVPDRRGRLRLDRRHLGRARRLLRGGGHPVGRAAAEGQGLHRPARAAARQRRARALARHRLRRVHGDRAGDRQGASASTWPTR